jgi:hypothetical protein
LTSRSTRRTASSSACNSWRPWGRRAGRPTSGGVTLRGYSSRFDGDGDSGSDRHRVRERFARFVDLLGRCGRESGGGGARSVTFSEVFWPSERDRVRFGIIGGGGMNPTVFALEDEARLFGEVLPNLPRLERLRFSVCDRYEANLALFASRLLVPAPASAPAATSSLVELDVESSHGRGSVSACVPAIAALIRCNGVPLQVLKLRLSPYVMGRNACQQIFGSLRHNTTLRRLEVLVLDVYEGVPILPPGSTIRTLQIEIRQWTQRGKSILARQLTTNTVWRSCTSSIQGRGPSRTSRGSRCWNRTTILSKPSPSSRAGLPLYGGGTVRT